MVEKQDLEGVDQKLTANQTENDMDEMLDELEDKDPTIEDQIANLTPETIALVKQLLEAEKKVADDLKPEDEDLETVCSQLAIRGDKRYGNFVIRREGGSGKVPSILQGAYTDHDKAVLALDLYKRGLLKPSGKWARKALEEAVEAKIVESFQAKSKEA